MGASAVCIALPGSRIIHIPAQPQPSSPHRQLALSPELGLAWVFSVLKNQFCCHLMRLLYQKPSAVALLPVRCRLASLVVEF